MPKLDAKLLTQAAYARHRGVSRPAVAKALREGRITATAEGLIDPVAADAQWQANTRPRVKLQADAQDAAVPTAAQHDDAPITYQEAKRRTAVAEMLQAERAAALQARQLVTVKSVKALWQTVLTTCKARLLNIASRVSPQVPQPHTRLVFDAITAEVHEALLELSRTDGTPAEEVEG